MSRFNNAGYLCNIFISIPSGLDDEWWMNLKSPPDIMELMLGVKVKKVQSHARKEKSYDLLKASERESIAPSGQLAPFFERGENLSAKAHLEHMDSNKPHRCWHQHVNTDSYRRRRTGPLEVNLPLVAAFAEKQANDSGVKREEAEETIGKRCKVNPGQYSCFMLENQ
ncbi:hypothetical protein MHYP_G00122150 [Metynnis hypsauchen]